MPRARPGTSRASEDHRGPGSSPGQRIIHSLTAHTQNRYRRTPLVCRRREAGRSPPPTHRAVMGRLAVWLGRNPRWCQDLQFGAGRAPAMRTNLPFAQEFRCPVRSRLPSMRLGQESATNRHNTITMRKGEPTHAPPHPRAHPTAELSRTWLQVSTIQISKPEYEASMLLLLSTFVLTLTKSSLVRCIGCRAGRPSSKPHHRRQLLPPLQMQ